MDVRPPGGPLSARLALLATGCLLAACEGGGPVGEDLAPAAARLHVVATYVDSVDSYIDIHAWLVPGVTMDGRIRDVSDPVLGVAGRRIEPTGTGGQPGELVYRVRWPVESEAVPRTALTIDPPRVAGVVPNYGPVRWFTFGREGPVSISWSRGEDLTLRLEPPAEGSTPPPEVTGAGLTLRGSDQELTSLRGPFPPVTPIVVPPELVPATGSSFPAVLSLGLGRAELPPGEEYEIVASMELRIYWAIQVVGGGS